MTKREAIQAVQTARNWLKKGKNTWCRERAKEVAGELDAVLDCMAGKAQYIDDGGTRMSRADAVDFVAAAGDYAFAIDPELGIKFGKINGHILADVPWDVVEESESAK